MRYFQSFIAELTFEARLGQLVCICDSEIFVYLKQLNLGRWLSLDSLNGKYTIELTLIALVAFELRALYFVDLYTRFHRNLSRV